MSKGADTNEDDEKLYSAPARSAARSQLARAVPNDNYFNKLSERSVSGTSAIEQRLNRGRWRFARPIDTLICVFDRSSLENCCCDQHTQR